MPPRWGREGVTLLTAGEYKQMIRKIGFQQSQFPIVILHNNLTFLPESSSRASAKPGKYLSSYLRGLTRQGYPSKADGLPVSRRPDDAVLLLVEVLTKLSNHEAGKPSGFDSLYAKGCHV